MDKPRRPPPSAEGRFGKTPFAHVLLYVREHALSGTLSVDGPAGGPMAGEHFFVFERGELAQSWIATGIDRLGDLLVEMKLVAASSRRDAEVLLAAAPQLVGDAFVEMGVADHDAIARALREQNRRRAHRIFTLGNATYRFYQDLDLLQGFGRERFSVNVLAIVWKGVCASPPHATIEQLLARLGDAPIKLRAGAQLDAFEFEPDVERVLDVLRLGPASIADLEAFSPDPQLARTLAYVLLTSKQADASAQRQANHPPAAAPAPAPAPAPVAAPPVAQDPRAKEADDLLATMDEQTYFEMLGVAVDAPDDAIRAAFMKLAAKWHPDRATGPAAKESYQRLFALINDAHQALSDPKARERYTRVAKDGGGTPAAQKKVAAMLEASTLAQKSEIHLRRRELNEAESLAREAMSLHDEDPAVLAALGAVLIEKNAPEQLDEALATLTQAVTLAPKNDRAQVLLAHGYKRKNDAAKALAHYKLALEANPKNVDAAREVRLAEMRSRNAPAAAPAKADEKPAADKSPAGLLSKLFKR